MQRRIYSILILLVSAGMVQAQTTSSPYSIYGIGTIQTSSYNRTTGMGNAGIGYRSDNNIIQNNPASYTALMPQIFHIEAGGSGDFSTYSGALFNTTPGSSQISNDFTVTRIAFATKVTKWWGSSIGLMPYSKMTYDFSGAQPLGNTGQEVAVTYQGSGGIHKAYWGNAVSLGKHFSVGATCSFLFGALQQNETTVNPAINANLVTTRNLYMRNAVFDFGVQYYTHLGAQKNWNLVLGATYTPIQPLYAEDSLDVTNGGTALPNGASTLLDRNVFQMPNAYGAGFSLSKESTMRRVTFTGDYTTQLWTPLGYSGTGYALGNSYKYAGGVEIAKKANLFNTPLEHVYYQFGGYCSKTYLSLDGAPVYEWGATLGLGVNPLRYYQWGYHLSLEYGQTSNYEESAIKENFVRLTITIHYWGDRWFTRGRRIL